MVERGRIDARLLLRVDGLHQVDLDLEGAGAEHGDILVDVLFFGAVVAVQLETEGVDPELAQLALVGGANRDLLNPKDLEGAFTHVVFFLPPRPGRDERETLEEADGEGEPKAWIARPSRRPSERGLEAKAGSSACGARSGGHEGHLPDVPIPTDPHPMRTQPRQRVDRMRAVRSRERRATVRHPLSNLEMKVRRHAAELSVRRISDRAQLLPWRERVSGSHKDLLEMCVEAEAIVVRVIEHDGVAVPHEPHLAVCISSDMEDDATPGGEDRGASIRAEIEPRVELASTAAARTAVPEARGDPPRLHRSDGEARLAVDMFRARQASHHHVEEIGTRLRSRLPGGRSERRRGARRREREPRRHQREGEGARGQSARGAKTHWPKIEANSGSRKGNTDNFMGGLAWAAGSC